MNKIKPTENRIIVSVDMDYKNSHTFDDGTKIYLERRVDNFDRKYTEPVNAIVIASDYIPEGSELIIHHNATHDSYRLFNYEPLGGQAIASGVKYFSIPDGMGFIYRLPGTDEWLPCNGFATGLRVFAPYKGHLTGIMPTEIKKKLYITSGELKGKVCLILHAADYEMVFQGQDGKEKRVIRVRHFEDDIHEREEIIGIDHEATELVNKGELYLGLSKSDAKPIKNANKREERFR